MNDSYKFIGSSNVYDLQPAEVLAVNYKDDDPEQLFSIKIKPILSSGLRDLNNALTARPLNYNNKKMPLVGEIVMIVKGPSPGASNNTNSSQTYYMDVFSIQSLLHHNALPLYGKNKVDRKEDTKNYGNVERGNTIVDDNGVKANELAKSFKEKNNIRPIQPYAGDNILEGRFNQGIRFGSTIINTNDYSLVPSWRSGQSTEGDPITIIRNGRNPNSISSIVNKFYIENIEDDLSSIWLTAGQQLSYTPNYSNFRAIDRLNINTFKVGDNYTGNQIGIFSDRVILAAKKQEILLQSEAGIAINSAKSVAFDVEETLEINAERINLGLDASEPALLGDTSGNWLSDLLTQLINLCNTLAVEVHPTGVGPSLPPLQASVYANIASQLITLQGKIQTLKSELVFLNKT
jgi:hypothetical protein